MGLSLSTTPSSGQHFHLPTRQFSTRTQIYRFVYKRAALAWLLPLLGLTFFAVALHEMLINSMDRLA